MHDAREIPAGEYWFDDFQEGDYLQTGALVITESQIVAFAGLSGDFFDVHMDDDFAQAQGFPSRIAHGLLGLALTDGLKNRASVRIMAIASLGWNWQVRAALVAGDRISACICVRSKRLSSKGQGVVTLGLSVTKRDGLSSRKAKRPSSSASSQI